MLLKNESTVILKAQWHPISSIHVGVLIRTQNRSCKFLLFNVKENVDEPEQEIILNRILPNDIVSRDFTSFVFSSHSSGWDQFTVYFLTKGGQIFSYCPLIPFKMSVNKEVFASLMENTSSEKENEWLSDIFKPHQLNTLITTKHTNPFPYANLLQGPLIKAPSEIYRRKETKKGWKELYFYPTGPEEPIVLLMGHSKAGIVRCCTQILPTPPFFHRSQKSSIIVFDNIDLEIPPPKNEDRLQITCYPSHGLFFVHHWDGVHTVHINFPTLEDKGQFDSSTVDRIDDITGTLVGLVAYTPVDSSLPQYVLVWSTDGPLTHFMDSFNSRKLTENIEGDIIEDTKKTTLDLLNELKKKYNLTGKHVELQSKEDSMKDKPITDFDILVKLDIHAEFLSKNHKKFLEEAEDLMNRRLTELGNNEEKVRNETVNFVSKLEEMEKKQQSHRILLDNNKERQKALESFITCLIRQLNYKQFRLSEKELAFQRDLPNYQKEISLVENDLRRLSEKVSSQEFSRQPQTPNSALFKRRKRVAIKSKLEEHGQEILALERKLDDIKISVAEKKVTK